MLNVIDGYVFTGLLVIGIITGLVVCGTRRRQGYGQIGNGLIGALGSLLGGLFYDLCGIEDFFALGWDPLMELLIFAIAGAGLLSLVLLVVRRRLNQN
jgi:uncharacterized membrane protein YeaQ/YmgE (transglycosylase-associated protein family)